MALDFRCPKENRLRTVLCMPADAKAGDLIALAHYLLTPKFEIEGIVINGSKNKEDNSALRMLKALEAYVNCPVVFDSQSALENGEENKAVEAVDFIIRQCRLNDERPLYISVMGALTTVAAAYLKAPEIVRYITVIWAGGAPWRGGGYEENLNKDILAAEILFASDADLWQIPRDTYGRICISGAEIQQKIAPFGQAGNLISECAVREIQKRNDYTDMLILPGEAVFGALFNPFDHAYEWLPAPKINHQMYYIHHQKRCAVRVYYFLDSRMILEDLYSKLAVLFGEGGRR